MRCSTGASGSSRLRASARPTRSSPSRYLPPRRGRGCTSASSPRAPARRRCWSAPTPRSCKPWQSSTARPAVKDPYWTLVGYFNSLRVLGGARMQVQDDVNDRLDLLSRRHSSREARNRTPDRADQPRSRPATSPTTCAGWTSATRIPEALDVILATNMISVGVDINRLGLMAVMGQPQSTSEYIQATSRVGRRYPGLVITMLNAAKSRDRSHYESFRDFHAALYRQVESSSVTPVLGPGALPGAARRPDRPGPADRASAQAERQRKEASARCSPASSRPRRPSSTGSRRVDEREAGEHRSRARSDHRQMGATGRGRARPRLRQPAPSRQGTARRRRTGRTRTSRAPSRPCGACVMSTCPPTSTR